jgi:hypothetical protein
MIAENKYQRDCEKNEVKKKQRRIKPEFILLNTCRWSKEIYKFKSEIVTLRESEKKFKIENRKLASKPNLARHTFKHFQTQSNIYKFSY